MRRQVLAATLLLLGLPGFGAGIESSRAAGWVWPLDPLPRVVRSFEPPTSPYGPGHRGVDLAGSVGQSVLSIASGIVTFSGSIAGRGVLVVDHGRLSSTYQPVSALVDVGDVVVGGQPVGALQLVHSHCAPDACLHLGVRHGDVYVDPLRLLPARPVRLKPLGGLGGSAGARHGPGTGVMPHGSPGALTGLLAGQVVQSRP